MTINGLWKLIETKYPSVVEYAPQSSFKGRRVAIDAYNLAYVTRSIVQKRVVYGRDILRDPIGESDLLSPWLLAMLDKVLEMMRRDIIPILVYDGEEMTEKAACREKRSKERENIQRKLDDVLARYESGLGLDKELLNEARRYCSQLIHIPRSSMEAARHFFSELGIPTALAKGDGERLCSALCRSGLAMAVLSSDGDNLAHGAPLLIKGTGPRIYDQDNCEIPTFAVIRLEKLLGQLDMDAETFTQLCIMCGCDYNSNMKGIAAVKSLGLIKSFGGIENLPDQYETSCLRYDVCRDLFHPLCYQELIEGDCFFDPRKYDDCTLQTLQGYGLESRALDVMTVLNKGLRGTLFRHSLPVTVFDSKRKPIFQIREEDPDTLEGVEVFEPQLKKETKTARASRHLPDTKKREDKFTGTDNRLETFREPVASIEYFD